MEATGKKRGSRPVFLIKPETERENYRLAPPLGILYLAGALEKSRYPVRLVHERFSPANEKKIVDDILAADPLFVGISTFTGPSLKPSLDLAMKLKKRSSVPVIWGGLHSTMLPEQTLKEEAIDLAVCGEGEETIVRLADLIAAGNCVAAELEKVPGVAFRDRGRIRVNPPPPYIRDLDAFAPAWHLLDGERYMAKGKSIYTAMGSRMSDLKVAPIMTSRGCPWRCGYCYNQFVNKRTFRVHSIAFVNEYVGRLKKEHGVTGIVFEDDCFFTDRPRALAILRQMDLPWTSSIRADCLARGGDDLARELKELGCCELRIGAESGSQSTLDIMHKDIRREHIIRSAELCRKHGIHVGMGFMIGIPGESWAEMEKTLDIIDELERMDVAVVPGPSIYFPYPGTPLFAEAVRLGYAPPASLKAWVRSSWGAALRFPPYIDRRARYVGYYRSLAMHAETGRRRFALVFAPLKRLARWRWRRRFFSFPIDYLLPKFIMGCLRKLGLEKIAADIYDK